MKRSFIIVLAVGVTAVLFAGVAALLALRLFLVDLHFIPQNGMYPSLRKGAYVISARRPYVTVGNVSRGDVVVYVQIQDGHRYLYIWRVVGLPGDRIIASADSLTLNGEVVTRELVRTEDEFAIFRELLDDSIPYEVAIDHEPDNIPPDVTLDVAADQLFVMGIIGTTLTTAVLQVQFHFRPLSARSYGHEDLLRHRDTCVWSGRGLPFGSRRGSGDAPRSDPHRSAKSL